MSAVRIIAWLKVKPGKLDAFQETVTRLVSMARANDPGTLVYDWFIDEKSNRSLVIEEYRSGDCLIAHIKNVGDSGLAANFAAAAELERIEVCGDITPEVATICKGFVREGGVERPQRCLFYRAIVAL